MMVRSCAIAQQGKSLLPAGIRQIDGDFQRVILVAILALDGREVVVRVKCLWPSRSGRYRRLQIQ